MIPYLIAITVIIIAQFGLGALHLYHQILVSVQSFKLKITTKHSKLIEHICIFVIAKGLTYGIVSEIFKLRMLNLNL